MPSSMPCPEVLVKAGLPVGGKSFGERRQHPLQHALRQRYGHTVIGHGQMGTLGREQAAGHLAAAEGAAAAVHHGPGPGDGVVVLPVASGQQATVEFSPRQTGQQARNLDPADVVGLRMMRAGFLDKDRVARPQAVECRRAARQQGQIALEAGKGFLQGTQIKYGFVPERHTDFIFCTVGEEWGFVGATVVLTLLCLLILRLMRMGERQEEPFGRIYCYSVASILLFHVLVNVGMAIGLMPVMGIPLPFMSYGGSSLIAFTILLFIAVRLDASTRQFTLNKF